MQNLLPVCCQEGQGHVPPAFCPVPHVCLATMPGNLLLSQTVPLSLSKLFATCLPCWKKCKNPNPHCPLGSRFHVRIRNEVKKGRGKNGKAQGMVGERQARQKGEGREGEEEEGEDGERKMVGKGKAQGMEQRARRLNPSCSISRSCSFILIPRIQSFHFPQISIDERREMISMNGFPPAHCLHYLPSLLFPETRE